MAELEVTNSGQSGKAEIKEIPLSLLVPALWNPNELTEEKFNNLFDNMAEHGWLEPLAVRPIADGKYEIIGGHHRLEVAKLLEWSVAPCIVKHGLSDFDIKIQNMRLNVIRGKINPEKFTKLYQQVQMENPDRDIAQEMGLLPDELQRLIVETEKTLPPEVKADFDKAKSEIKTVNQLVMVLNELFAKQGKQLEKYHFMILDYDGKESIWVRMLKGDISNAHKVIAACKKQGVTVDGLMRKLFAQLIAQDEAQWVTLLSDVEPAEDEVVLGEISEL